MSASEIRIGTSGWHYPSGSGKWTGTFYPHRQSVTFDELTYYARFFNFVEINSSFYGALRPEISRSWAEKTPADFIFSAKLHQRFTHPQMFARRTRAALAKRLDTSEIDERTIAALVEANAADLDDFKRGLEPLASASKLGPLLAQFPASFSFNAESLTHLAAVLRAFGNYRIAVELRHRSWSDRLAETRSILRAFDAALAWIDEPHFKDSALQGTIDDSAGWFYARLHGRNAANWWRGSVETRYAYDYSREELEPIAGAIRATGISGFVAANNHANARSISTAAQMRDLFGQTIPNLDALGALVKRQEMQ